MEENPLCPFGDVLVKARKERGITQYRLAKLTKRSARYISMLEHNAREQQLSTGLLLARALRMDAGELVRDVDALMPEGWRARMTKTSSRRGPGTARRYAELQRRNEAVGNAGHPLFAV